MVSSQLDNYGSNKYTQATFSVVTINIFHLLPFTLHLYHPPVCCSSVPVGSCDTNTCACITPVVYNNIYIYSTYYHIVEMYIEHFLYPYNTVQLTC